jgi:hypothetical protein
LVPRCQFALVEPLHARVDVIHAGLMGTQIAPSLATEVNLLGADLPAPDREPLAPVAALSGERDAAPRHRLRGRAGDEHKLCD